ncbi:hypothetical protein [Xanthocytophaga agilis]|uniref:Lipoprotein n=1 Tax=Xanthocytophaga agilis TaxID=3048010 RepID=A0AAE3QYD4_9BACT|nr:hypothetical protein [Xanthocytophaga agilis]MDJ1500286.1 hypothetical protein [Xanthocytophaga agilis]
MKPYYYLILCLLLGCKNEKKETSLKPPVTSNVDTSLSFNEMLHIPQHSSEAYGEYESFLRCKKLLQISDSTSFKNDYEIRLYLFGSFQGLYCYKYTLHNNEWKGERIILHYSTTRQLEREPVSPKEGWKTFIQNAINNGLLNIPTREEMNQEIVQLGKLYPDVNLQIIDGGSVMIETITKDHYELRLYNNQLSLADDMKLYDNPRPLPAGVSKPTVLKKINTLIKSLVIYP